MKACAWLAQLTWRCKSDDVIRVTGYPHFANLLAKPTKRILGCLDTTPLSDQDASLAEASSPNISNSRPSTQHGFPMVWHALFIAWHACLAIRHRRQLHSPLGDATDCGHVHRWCGCLCGRLARRCLGTLRISALGTGDLAKAATWRLSFQVVPPHNLARTRRQLSGCVASPRTLVSLRLAPVCRQA